MRTSKTITLHFNGDSVKEIECSMAYDGWSFDGTKEECLEQLESLIGQLEIDARGMKE